MVPQKKKKTEGQPTASFTAGAIALVFLVIGYQVALFVHKAAVTRIVANQDHPDTVYVVPQEKEGAPVILRSASDEESHLIKKSSHSARAVEIRQKAAPRKVESFPFNPNTASTEELQRLGFSEKQALSIVHYREKGGRFRRPEDFAKSYVVSDSVYKRLEPYIRIPKIDINQVDSLALLDLPGVGPYFAGKILQYRKRLGGYSTVDQLLEIYHFDAEKLDGMRDLITCSSPEPYALWALPEEELSKHPHISRSEAHGIVLYRSHNARDACTLEALRSAGVLSEEHYRGLSLCHIAPAI